MCSECNLLQLFQIEFLWPFMVLPLSLVFFFLFKRKSSPKFEVFCIAKSFGRLREAWSVKFSTEFGLFIAENRRMVRAVLIK